MATKAAPEIAASVYEKIAAVQSALAKTGISKSRKNQQQNYQFRGIDDVYDALAPLLAEHGLCIIPRMVNREVIERQTRNGGALFYVTVEAEFDFVSANDGSAHTARTFGEAMDSGDKATNKAMSAAYKYAALMTFAIPTEGDNDADATTHDVAPRSSAKEAPDAAGGQSKGTVSPRQLSDSAWAKLVQLIEATETNVGKLCAAYNVSELNELSEAQVADAEKALGKKLAKLAATAKSAPENTSQFGELLNDEIPY